MNKSFFKKLIAIAAVLIMALSTVATAFATYDTIPYGYSGTRVRKMQNALKNKGYYTGKVDGIFGPSTKAAVKEYQRHIGLRVDGKPGNKTLTALYEGVSKINNTNTGTKKSDMKVSNSHTLYYGCTGSRVKDLQKALKKAGVYHGSCDGIFGELTEKAVRKYQSKNGLQADGKAGTKTLKSLKLTTEVKVSKSFVLARGSKGKEVEKLKRFLVKKGYTVSEGDTLHSADVTAINNWKATVNLPTDGEIPESIYNHYIVGLS